MLWMAAESGWEQTIFFEKLKKLFGDLNSLWAFKWAIDESVYSLFYKKIPFVYFESDRMVITFFYLCLFS